MRRKIISETVEAIFDQIGCSFFLQKTHCSYLSCAKKLFGPKKIIFGALGRHLVQSHGAFWGVFKNWGFNPQFLKAFSGAEASDLSIRWLQASTGTFQKMRIESSILENSPKSPMGWDYHPFLGGEKKLKKVAKFFLHPHDTYKKYILQKNWTKTVNPALSSDVNILPPAIWGSHCQLDDHQNNPNINNRDHLDG